LEVLAKESADIGRSSYSVQPMKRSDEQLVAAAINGDRQSMNDLLGRHYDRIYGICRRIAGNEADALDATQEALIAITRRLDRFDGHSAFSTWSYRVATNACLDELRRRKRRPDPTDDAVLALRLDSQPLTAVQGHPDITADRVTSIDSIATALDQLDERFRVPVIMRDVMDLDYAQIAAELAVPVGTVKSRIARGRTALAKIIGTDEGPPDVQTGDHG